MERDGVLDGSRRYDADFASLRSHLDKPQVGMGRRLVKIVQSAIGNACVFKALNGHINIEQREALRNQLVEFRAIGYPAAVISEPGIAREVRQFQELLTQQSPF